MMALLPEEMDVSVLTGVMSIRTMLFSAVSSDGSKERKVQYHLSASHVTIFSIPGKTEKG
jgi:hypothetical protein